MPCLKGQRITSSTVASAFSALLTTQIFHFHHYLWSTEDRHPTAFTNALGKSITSGFPRRQDVAEPLTQVAHVYPLQHPLGFPAHSSGMPGSVVISVSLIVLHHRVQFSLG